MTIESVLKEIFGKNFSKVTTFCLDYIKKSNQDEDGIRKTFESLYRLGIKTDKIASKACLLRWNVKIIEDRFKKLVSLGFSRKKINTNASLLGMKSRIMKERYDKIIDLGISRQKINTVASLVGMKSETVKDHYDKIIDLGISSEKIAQNSAILANKPKTIQENYNYLTNVIDLDESKILNQPQLLLFNPDTFAKKLRILKLDILGLKRKSLFQPNKYVQLYIASSSTLLAKKNYCERHKIDFRNNLRLISRHWGRIIKRVDKKINSAEAGRIGRILTRPYKQRYDKWMGEYKKWCGKFYRRRGRRLIVRI